MSKIYCHNSSSKILFLCIFCMRCGFDLFYSYRVMRKNANFELQGTIWRKFEIEILYIFDFVILSEIRNISYKTFPFISFLKINCYLIFQMIYVIYLWIDLSTTRSHLYNFQRSIKYLKHVFDRINRSLIWLQNW